jgi:CBS domain-containing protein
MASLPRRRTIADVMTAHVHCASSHTPFKLLVRLIEENRISAVPIVDHLGMPVGIVSETDLMIKKRRHAAAWDEGLVAEDIMTSPAVTIPADALLADAARLMQERGIRRLVVVDSRGRLAGIATRSDLLQVFLRTDEDLRREIVDELLPALLESPDRVHADVRWNVVTLTGEVERKSQAAMLTRATRELDGVVDVKDRMTHVWDDMAVASSR